MSKLKDANKNILELIEFIVHKSEQNKRYLPCHNPLKCSESRGSCREESDCKSCNQNYWDEYRKQLVDAYLITE